VSAIAPFDLIVIGSIAFGALVGLIVGLLRGGLLALSWAGAAAGTVFLFPYAEPHLHKAIQPPMVAIGVGGGAIFLFLLIALHLLSYSISDRVKSSRLRLLDRTLGLMAGVALPAAILSAGYLFGRESVPPSWMEGARTKPLIEQGAKWIDELLPPDFKIPGIDKPPSEELKGLGDTLPSAAQLLRPSQTGRTDNDPAYRGTDRRNLDNEMGRRP
jgi:membrane protein required for colicin V production